MYTVANYAETSSDIDVAKLPQALKEGHKFTLEFADLYNDNADIKETIDLYLSAVNKQAKSKPKASTPVESKNYTASTFPKQFKNFVPPMQQKVVAGFDESNIELVDRLTKEIKAIPKLYSQDGKEKEAIVYAHFFYGQSDWFITEYNPEEKIAFGYVILNGDAMMSEFGNISIEELHNTHKVELDFHWKTKPLAEALYNTDKNYFPNPAKKAETKEKGGTTPKNLAHLKKWLKANKGNNIYFLDLRNDDAIEREIVTVQGNSVSFSTPGGNESWIDYGKASDWKFTEDYFSNGILFYFYNDIKYSEMLKKTEYVVDNAVDTLKKALKDNGKPKFNSIEEFKDVFAPLDYEVRIVLANHYFGSDREANLKKINKLALELNRSKKPKPCEDQPKKAKSSPKKKATAKKKAEPKQEAPKVRPKMVRHLEEDQKIINQFTGMIGKERTAQQIRTFHNRIVKSFADASVTDKTPLKKELLSVKEKVEKVLAAIKDWKDSELVKITMKDEDEYRALKAATKVFPSVMLFKALVALNYTTPEKEKVEALKKRFNTAIEKESIVKEDPFYDELKAAHRQLEKWVAGDQFKLIVNTGLSGSNGGLNGLGCALQYCNCMNEQTLNGITEIAFKGLLAASAISSLAKNTKEEPTNEPAPQEERKQIPTDGLFTTADKAAEIKTEKTTRLPGEIGKFLQDFQPYKYAITLRGPMGGGKTTMCTQMMDAFLDAGYTVGWFSLEQGGLEAKDTVQLIDRNVKEKNRARLAITGESPKGLESVKEYANKFDVVFIDSWQKLRVSQEEFDSLRHEYPNVIWVVIFQENAEGGMRGGNAAGFDGNCILKINKPTGIFKDNYAIAEKNRGNDTAFVYNIMEQKTYPLEDYKANRPM